jgi:hypothetical protein
MKQYINQNLQLLEYSGEKKQLFFEYVVNNTVLSGLTIDIRRPMVINRNIINISNSSPRIVTVNSAGHGFSNNDILVISNNSVTSNNKSWTITVLSDTTFSLNGSVSEGSGSAGTGGSAKKDSFEIIHQSVSENTIVWVANNGPYIVKENSWVLLEDVKILFSQGSKIYGLDDHGNYNVTNLSTINDTYNQIRYLEDHSGYILLSNNSPYLLYEHDNQLLNITDNPKIMFDVYKCSMNNGVQLIFNDRLPKLITLNGLFTGFCDDYKKAVTKIYGNLTNLDTNRDYTIKLKSNNKDVIIRDSELLLNNITSANYFYNTEITFNSDLVNSIFNLTLELYVDQTLIDYDNLAVYLECPRPPAPTPTPINPITATFTVVS